VAVKVLPGQTLLDPIHLRRFNREAQTAARLHHTNIVPVFGVGEQDGFHYIVMQLIDGAGLDDVLASLRQANSQIPTAAGKAVPTFARQSATTPPRSRDGTEVSRLARALADGQFGQLHGFDSASSDGSDELGQTQEQTPTAGRPSSPAGTATEEFAFNGDTKVNGDHPAASPNSAKFPAHDEPWQFGPPYWRSVATIGQQVAEALDYAHIHHTLHRDIKPANLLLDSQGVAWITDFGLAKAMEQDNVTQTGAMVGTLRYMAPEQFSGHADARSDIYSLGLTLYELLTLRPAFEANSRSSLIAKIAHGEPPAPRKFNPAIPRDLETIVLKAMAREPRDRYPTAGELAQDLECFLEDRPIQARRTPPAERLWRWARRNRAVAGLITSTLVLLVVVAVVASVGYLRTSQANAQEKIQRHKAEETSALAVEALDSIFQQFAPDRTAPVSASLRVSDTEDPITPPVQPVLSKEAAALLEHMLKFYDRLSDQGDDDARLHRKVAQANGRVGDIRQRLGQYAESKTAYLRAIDLYTRLAKSSATTADLHTEIARVQNELGNVYDAMKDGEAGRKSHLDALATLQAASAESSAAPDCQYELARTYYFLGKGSGGPPGPHPPGLDGPHGPRDGRHGFVFDPRGPDHGRRPPFPVMPAQEGEESLDKALALWQCLTDDDSPWPASGPNGPHGHQVGQPRGQPGSPPFFSENNRKESEQYRNEAVKLLERLVADHPEVPGYRHLLARCYRETPPMWAGRGANSESDSLDKAAQILEKLAEKYPDVADYRYDLSETYALLGDRGSPGQESPDGDTAKHSLATLEKALTLSEQLVAEHPNIPDYAVSSVFIRLRLSGSLWASDPTRTEENLRKALDVQSTLVRRFPENSSNKFWKAVIQESLGRLFQKHDRLPEARIALQDCIVSFNEVLQHDAKEWRVRGILSMNYINLADVLRHLGEDKAAEEAMGQAQNLRQKR
ncbi:MAG: serine/threonine-protein kinase, partial [Thermoguttaceae bacterium]|jgi:tetratricopeptide (TPR) repeat protein